MFPNQPCLRVGPPSPPPPGTFVPCSHDQYFLKFCRPNIPAVFVVQTSYIKRFCTIAKKMRLDTRIRMHRSRASGASNLSRYGRFCATGLLSVWPDPPSPPAPWHLCSLFLQSIFSFKCKPNISRLQSQYIAVFCGADELHQTILHSC